MHVHVDYLGLFQELKAAIGSHCECVENSIFDLSIKMDNMKSIESFHTFQQLKIEMIKVMEENRKINDKYRKLLELLSIELGNWEKMENNF